MIKWYNSRQNGLKSRKRTIGGGIDDVQVNKICPKDTKWERKSDDSDAGILQVTEMWDRKTRPRRFVEGAKTTLKINNEKDIRQQ